MVKKLVGGQRKPGRRVRYSFYMDEELLGLMKGGYRALTGVESFNEYCVRVLRDHFVSELCRLKDDG